MSTSHLRIRADQSALTLRGLLRFGSALCGLLCVTNAIALSTLQTEGSVLKPALATVVSGVAMVTQNGAITRVEQTSPDVVLVWSQFNIGRGATLDLRQPSSDATVVIRVTDAQVSEVLGRIQANGRVILVNSHGIVFGTTAQVNVGGLLASTLDVSPNAESGRDRLNANGKRAGIVNHGLIEVPFGDSVELIGANVRNEGTIVADGGTIQLGAADHATPGRDDDGSMSITLASTGGQRVDTSTSVSNAGILQAYCGRVVMQTSASKGSSGNGVDNSGEIDASCLGIDGGSVRLMASSGDVANSGTINVSGLHGGSAHLLSDKNVRITGSVDASGEKGGGSILVGGGYQGGGGLQRAAVTYAGAQAALNANAVSSGNGGQVVLWSDQATGFKGAISARGGVNGGNGGDVEVSSDGYLEFAGYVDLQATHGVSGNLLLDPGNVVISSAADSGSGFDFGGTFNQAAAGTDSNINTTTLVNQLASSNVTITAPGTAPNTGNIKVQNAIDFTGSNNRTLELRAGGTISFAAGATVAASGAGQLSGVLSGAKGVTFANASGFATNGGDLTMTSSAGAVKLGALSLAQGSLSVVGTGITQSGAITQAPGAGSVAFDGGTGAVTLTNPANDFYGVVSLTGGVTKITALNYLFLSTLNTGALTATSTGALTLGTGTVNGNLSASGSSIVFNGALNGLQNLAFVGAVPTGIGSAAGTGSITGLGASTFNLTGTNQGKVGSVTFNNFGAADAATVINATSFNLGSKVVNGITFASLSSVQGNGASSTITGSGNTFTLDDSVANAGSGSGVIWSAFNTIIDPTGTINFGTAGFVSGSVTAQKLGYSGYGSPVLFNLSNASSATTSGIGGTWAGVTAVVGSAGNDTISGSAQTYTLTGPNAGNAGTVGWTGFEKLSDSGAGKFIFANGGSVSGTATAVGGTLNYSAYSTAVNVGLGGSATGTGGWSGISTIIGGSASDTISGNNQTFTLSGANAGGNGSVSWSGLENINDAAGTVEFGASGSVSGNVSAQTLNYSSYVTPLTFNLSAGNNTTSGVGGSWSGVATVVGSGNADTIAGTNQTYSLTSANAGNNGSVRWFSFENAQDSGNGTLSATNQTWTLTGHNQGSLTNLAGFFSGIAKLTDTGTGSFFMHSGADGDISGALNAGTNGSVDFTGYTTAVNVNLSGAGTTGVAGTTAGISSVAANTNLGVRGVANGVLGITTTGASTTTTLGALSVGSNLTINSSGALQQTGALTVIGITAVNAVANAITLNNTGNHFGGVVDLNGGTTVITDQAALTLGTLSTGALTATSGSTLNLGQGSIGGSLSATSSGALTQSGSLQVAGSGNLQAGSSVITVTSAGNHFGGAVTASGHGVTLVDAGTLTIAAVSAGINGTLSLTAGGALFVPLSPIDTGTADLTLVANGGSFVTPGILSGGNITLAGRDGLTLNSNLFSLGIVSLTSSNGAINQVGGIVYSATLTGGSGGDATLAGANKVGTLGSFSSANFSLSNAQALTVNGPLSLSGSLNLATTAGALTVTSNVSTNTATLISATDLNVATNLAATTLSVQSGGNISQSGGVLTVSTLTGSSTGNTTLSGANKVGTLGNFSATRFELVNTSALATTGPLNVGSGGINLTAPGGTISGALSTPGVTRIRSAPATMQVQPGASFSAGTQILDGTLQINAGSSVGAVTVSSGATLSGIGSTGAIINNGKVAPGVPATPYGTLTAASYVADSSATLQIAADTTNNSSAALSVSGTATLAGNLVIATGATQPTSSTQITVLSASAVINPFASVTAPASSIAPEAQYSATSVNVTFDPPLSVGGTITGLTSSGLILRLNGGNDLAVAANATSFSFDQLLRNGDSYVISVGQQPAGQLCSVTANASGTVVGSNVSDVVVTCAVAQAQLSLSIDDGRDYVRYGQILNYVVRLTNSGNATAQVAISSLLDAGLDDVFTQWTCFGGDAGSVCQSNGTGPLTDSAVVLPAGRSLTWLVSTPVQIMAAGDSVATTITATPSDTALTPTVASDTDTLVLLRSGFDVPYGNGTSELGPVIAAAPVILGSDAIHVFNPAVMPSTQAIDTLQIVRLPNGSTAHVERTDLGGTPQVRLLLHMADGREVAGTWVRMCPGATMAISLVSNDTQSTLLLEGADSDISMLVTD